MRMRIIFLVFMFFQLSCIHAQQLIFENISDKLGLPSKECYNVMQDSRGYIWISTDAGLCKYDGNSLEIFDKNNGLPENSCYAVTEDSERTIWIGTSSHRIFLYRNNQLLENPLGKLISTKLFAFDSTNARLQFICVIKPIENGQIYVSTQHFSFTAGPRSGGLQQLMEKDTVADFYFQKRDRQLLSIKRGNIDLEQSLKHAKQGFILMQVDMVDSMIYIKIPTDGGASPDWRVLTASNAKGDLFISYYNFLIHIDKNNKYEVSTLTNRIIALYCDMSDGLWVGTYKNGGYYYADPSTSDVPVTILSEYSLSGIAEDDEGGIWCTTLEKGVFYSRNKNVLTYRNIPGLDIRAEMLKLIDGKIYISSLPGKVLVLDQKGSIQHQIETENNYLVKDVFIDGRTTYLFGPQFLKMIDEQGREKILKLASTNLRFGCIFMTHGPDNRLYVLNSSRNLNEVSNGSVLKNRQPMLGIGITLFYSKGENKLLMGAKNGVYEVNQKDLSLSKIPGVNGNVLKIILLKDGHLCFLTKESGIYLSKNGDLQRVDQKLKLPASIFYDIQEDDKNHVWIASNKGLIKITNNLAPSIQLYNTSNGLPADIIYNLLIHDEYIFLSTEEGISRFPLDEDLQNHIQPRISLHEFKINERDTTYREGMVLYYDQNSIKLTFHLPTFKDPGNTGFLYELQGAEEKTEWVKGNKLVLNKLPPGDYLLTVYGYNNDGVKSKVPLILHFEVKKPFWATTWWISFFVVLVILIIYIIIKVITNNIKRKEERKTALQRQISEFRLNAIQAQMNPHFIFNAINGIQHYILSNETQAAYDYLAKFSKLIRLVLSNSQNSMISLKKELETLELYLELEQKRFKNKFDFKIKLDEEVETEVKIPVMLVQPFVENSIWHGIMNLPENKKGKLTIDVSLEGDFLKITIEDNGVGREVSQALKTTSDHTSMGTLLSEKRLDLLKGITHKDQRIVITDLYNEHRIAAGTKVEIFLPTKV